MTSGLKASSLARIRLRGSASLSSGYKGNGTEGRPTTSAPYSSLGPPLGAKINTSSPLCRKHSTVLVSIVTMPSILGKNGSVIRAILIRNNSSNGAVRSGPTDPVYERDLSNLRQYFTLSSTTFLHSAI